MQRAVKAGAYDDVLGRTSFGRELPLGSTPKERYRNPWVDVGTYMRRSAMTDRPQLPESYTLEEWLGMLEEAGLDEAEVMKITPELQAAIKKYRQSLGPQGNTDPNRHAQVMPAVKKPKTSESYTLEEWMGALEEAGYDTKPIS